MLKERRGLAATIERARLRRNPKLAAVWLSQHNAGIHRLRGIRVLKGFRGRI